MNKRLKLALSIMSGRNKSFDGEDLMELGFDYYSQPDQEDVLLRCEEIVYDAIMATEEDVCI